MEKPEMVHGELERTGESLEARARRVLNMLVKWHSNPNHVATLAGIRPSYFHRTLNGERELPDAVKDKALVAMGIEPGFFLELQQGEDSLNPAVAARFLATCYDEPELPRDSFLDFLKAAVASWLASPHPPTRRRGEGYSVILERIQENFVRPRKAKVRIEDHLRKSLAGGGVAEVSAGELALTMAQWAMIRRARGFRADARDAYELAFRVLDQQSDTFAEGMLFQWAAVLLDDFERASVGLKFCDRAIRLLGTIGDPSLLGLCFFNRGTLLFGLRRFPAAERWLRFAIANLERKEKNCRFAARQCLAMIHLERGQARAAVGVIEAAAAECPDAPLFRAYLAWLEGQTLILFRNFAHAERLLEAALPVLDIEGEPLDAALATLDLAGIYLRRQKFEALTELLESSGRRLVRLRTNQRAQEILTEMMNLGLEGGLSEMLLRDGRNRLAAARRQPLHRRPRINRSA